jgi:hypothetical protein
MMNKKNGEIKLSDYNEFVKNIDEYININKLDIPNIKEDVIDCLELDDDDLSGMSKEDCLNASYRVLQYISHVQSETNKNLAINNWLENAITSICQTTAKSGVIDTSNEDFKYLKADAKRSVLLNCTDYGKELNRLNIIVKSRLTLLQDKVDVLKRISEILHDKGKFYG